MSQRSHVLIAVVVAGLVGCSSDDDGGGSKSKARHVDGPSGALGDGTVTTWADFDETGALSEVGFSIPMASTKLNSQESLFLELPADVVAAGFVNHIGINFNPIGHPPTGFQVRHFDLHFYGISISTRTEVDCVNEPMPSADVLPAPYAISSTELTPAGTCVPAMGVHAFDPSSPESSPTDPQPLTHTLLLGYHAGAMAFIEPVISAAFIDTKASFEKDVARPTSLGLSGSTHWPASSSGTYDETIDAYRIVVTEFTPLP